MTSSSGETLDQGSEKVVMREDSDRDRRMENSRPGPGEKVQWLGVLVLGEMVHSLRLSRLEAEAGKSLSLRAAWFT